MIPLYISGCFAVLHPGSARRGVLICAPLGDEALNAYRPLLMLAEKVSALGLPTLRLSYYGTGDSAGEDDEAGRFRQWLGSIQAGIEWLREQCGAHAVTLIGHRVGASLAARAACDSAAVDSLVLISPISGRQYLHELTLAARITQRVWQTSHKVDDGITFEAHGLRIDHATRDALNGLDLRKLPTRPAAQALLLEAEPRPATPGQIESLSALGTKIVFDACEGLERMLRDSFEAALPPQAAAAVTGWIGSLPAAAGAGRLDEPTAETSLELGAARETPIGFGPRGELFGVLSMPLLLASRGPAVVLVNTSSNPRWGNARIAVDIARSLAMDGVATLRMDAAGMGDAAPHTGEAGRPYSEATTQDVLHAAEELARRTQRPVAVLGICSGAYHALHAACSETRIRGLIVVNLQRFVWREGDPPDAVRRSDLRPTSFYVRNLLSAQAWYRLLRADFDAINLVRVLAVRVLRRVIAGTEPLLNLVFADATRVGRVRRMMQALARRGVPVLYLLGGNDPGVEELAAYFGSDGYRLRRQPNATVRVLDDADHTLSSSRVRTALIQDLRDWCQDNWRAWDSQPQREATDGGRIVASELPAHGGQLALLFRRARTRA